MKSKKGPFPRLLKSETCSLSVMSFSMLAKDVRSMGGGNLFRRSEISEKTSPVIKIMSNRG